MKGLLFSDIHFKLNSCQPLNKVADSLITLELKRAIDSIEFIKDLIKENLQILDFVAFLGDLFHSLNKNYNIIFYFAIQKMQELYNLCRDCNLKFVIVGGNHDYVAKNIFLTDLLPNDNKELESSGIKIINYIQDFSSDFYSIQADYILTHNEFKNLKFSKHIISKEGYSSSLCQVKYSILNGHYHMYQKYKNIVCVGSVYPQSLFEQSDFHGAIIFDFDKNYIYKKIQNDRVYWFKELKQEEYELQPNKYVYVLNFVPSEEYLEYLKEEQVLFYINPKILKVARQNSKAKEDVEYIIDDSSDMKQFIELLKKNYPKFIKLFDKYFNI